MASLKRLGTHQTTILKEGDYLVIQYWATPVVKFNDNEIILNGGGFRTQTIRTRMNQTSGQYQLGFMVSQRHGKWYVDYNNESIEFTDNMRIERTKNDH